MLSSKHILLGVSGGIAAYKAAELTRRLRDAGAEVRVVMTAGAQAFVTPLTFQALSGQPVHTELLDPAAEAAMGHIELARWADAVLIAPASADLIARIAGGQADDLLSTLILATSAPVFVAPAMNSQMLANPATQANLATLAARGMQVIPSAEGDLACGETGAGRLPEAPELIEAVSAHFARNAVLAGQKVVITAGPTREAIDPVRYLSNHSSGKMGYALAEAAVQAGASVVLVSGPVDVPVPAGCALVKVETAAQMHAAVMQAVAGADVFIACAAVADYRPETVALQKIKKTADALTLNLVKNPDILADVAARPDRPFCVGFAAETNDVLQHASSKLQRKQLDMICANDVSCAGIGFGSDNNALTVLIRDGNDVRQTSLCTAAKKALSRQLMHLISQESARKKGSDHKSKSRHA